MVHLHKLYSLFPTCFHSSQDRSSGAWASIEALVDASSRPNSIQFHQNATWLLLVPLGLEQKSYRLRAQVMENDTALGKAA